MANWWHSVTPASFSPRKTFRRLFRPISFPDPPMSLAWLFDPFRHEFMQRALFGCALIGFTNGMLSAFIVIRRLALMADAMAHSLLPGVAIALLFFGRARAAQYFASPGKCERLPVWQYSGLGRHGSLDRLRDQLHRSTDPGCSSTTAVADDARASDRHESGCAGDCPELPSGR